MLMFAHKDGFKNAADILLMQKNMKNKHVSYKKS